MLGCAIVVEGKLCGNVNGSAIYIDIAVGIHSVCIAAAHRDLQGSAVHFHSRRTDIGFARRVNSIVTGIDIDRTAIHLNPCGFHSFCRADGQIPVINLQNGCGMNTVISRRDI